MSEFQARVMQSASSKAGNLKKYVGAAVAGGSVFAGAASAQSTGIDVSTIVTVIVAVGVAGATIGLAVLSMHYGIKAYKWIRQAG